MTFADVDAALTSLLNESVEVAIEGLGSIRAMRTVFNVPGVESSQLPVRVLPMLNVDRDLRRRISADGLAALKHQRMSAPALVSQLASETGRSDAEARVKAYFDRAVEVMTAERPVGPLGDLAILSLREAGGGTRNVLVLKPLDALLASLNGEEPLPIVPAADLRALAERHRAPVASPDELVRLLRELGVARRPDDETERSLASLRDAHGVEIPEPFRTLLAHELGTHFRFALLRNAEDYAHWRSLHDAEGLAVFEDLVPVGVSAETTLALNPARPDELLWVSIGNPDLERATRSEVGPWLSAALLEAAVQARLGSPSPAAADAEGALAVHPYALPALWPDPV